MLTSPAATGSDCHSVSKFISLCLLSQLFSYIVTAVQSETTSCCASAHYPGMGHFCHPQEILLCEITCRSCCGCKKATEDQQCSCATKIEKRQKQNVTKEKHDSCFYFQSFLLKKVRVQNFLLTKKSQRLEPRSKSCINMVLAST